MIGAFIAGTLMLITICGYAYISHSHIPKPPLRETIKTVILGILLVAHMVRILIDDAYYESWTGYGYVQIRNILGPWGDKCLTNEQFPLRFFGNTIHSGDKSLDLLSQAKACLEEQKISDLDYLYLERFITESVYVCYDRSYLYRFLGTHEPKQFVVYSEEDIRCESLPRESRFKK